MRVQHGVLVLQTLLWPDEVRPSATFSDIGQANAPTSLEIEMAQALVASMSGEFNPADFSDEYQIELKKLLVSVAEGGRAIAAPKSAEPDREVEDLVAALQRSFEKVIQPD
ncbi:hypothetical protein FGL95_12505 [Nocardiaceae bacterium YC2-7]|uniref:Ku domain-containing protein n=1 Tax=Antrihabitans stalactiti TaxID=2584121 RepID=A0A848KJ01_9NOCA|nr:hypothetical protein [Antrihabitans stalactiti]NMN95857.1 hypothetical protein [Antrihabitans stalactiti]